MEQIKFPNNIFQALALIVISAILTSPILFFEKQLISLLGLDAVNVVYYVCMLLIAIGITLLINLRNGKGVHLNIGKVNKEVLLTSIVIIFLFHLGLTQVVIGAFTYLFNFHKNIDGIPINPPLFIGALLLAPILEEMLFRGIILEGFLSHYKVRTAIIISSVIFAICHGNIIPVTNALFSSLFISYIYFRERSLIMAIILHFSSNLMGLIFTFWRSKNPTLSTIDLYGSFTLLIYMIAILLLIITVWWLRKKYYPTNPLHEKLA